MGRWEWVLASLALVESGPGCSRKSVVVATRPDQWIVVAKRVVFDYHEDHWRAISWARSLGSLVPLEEPIWRRQCMRNERMGMFPNNVTGSSS